MDNYSQMPIASLEPQFSLWLKYLTTHQGANLFFLKNMGILPRLYQFCDYYRKHQRTKLKILDIKYSGTTDLFTFENELSKLKSHALIIAGDIFTRPDSGRLATALQNHYLTSRWSVLIAHECSPLELYSNQELLTSSLCVHPTPFALPTKQDTITQYIHNILKLWKVSLRTDQITQITQYCGNQPWLINELIRLWVENPEVTIETIITHPNFTFRVEKIFSELPSEYRDVLSRHNSNPEHISELSAFSLIDKDRHPIGTWLNDCLTNAQHTRLVTTPNQVIYDSVDLSRQFSVGERRLINLFNQNTNIITRESVANIFYDSQSGDYSDWALSQIITRLRRKLLKLNIPLDIKTKRGFGYVSYRS